MRYAGHHGGLPDKLGGGSLKDRLQRPRLPGSTPAWQAEIAPQSHIVFYQPSAGGKTAHASNSRFSGG